MQCVRAPIVCMSPLLQDCSDLEERAETLESSGEPPFAFALAILVGPTLPSSRFSSVWEEKDALRKLAAQRMLECALYLEHVHVFDRLEVPLYKAPKSTFRFLF